MGVSLGGSGFGSTGLPGFAIQKQTEASQADADLLQAEQNLQAARQSKSSQLEQIPALLKEVELKKSIATQKHTEANTAQQYEQVNYWA